MEYVDSDSFYDFLKISEDVGMQLEKLNVKEGDTIIVKTPDTVSPETQRLLFFMMRRRIDDLKLGNVCIIIVDSGVDIGVLDDRMMNEIGWRRVEL